MYKPLSIIAIATATAFSLGSCASSSKEGLKSLDASLLSDSIAAGSDFYEHVTERWQKAHPLTAEYSRYGPVQCAQRLVGKSREGDRYRPRRN